MLKETCKTLLKWSGWTTEVSVPARDKCIICVAPHTSNWDFILGELYYGSIGRKAGFLMKKEWFFWPLGYFFRALGGIPVTRDRKTSLTDQLADIAIRHTYFNLAVTPEGTRRLVTKWKRGFYYIALKAQIPIHLYALDGENKRIVCTRELIPSGDIEADFREIMEYYKPYIGKEIKRGKFAVETFADNNDSE